MFLIFGFKTSAQALGWVSAICRACGHSGGSVLVREVTKFSLFFIPLFPVRTRYVLECGNGMCRSRTKISREEAEGLIRGGIRAGH